MWDMGASHLVKKSSIMWCTALGRGRGHPAGRCLMSRSEKRVIKKIFQEWKQHNHVLLMLLTLLLSTVLTWDNDLESIIIQKAKLKTVD
uniref:Uncharacterized protein n=1 Tax=Anguilla anguilla TaxID=7936 RepID=A0A0E9SXW1_ANGAN